MTPLDPARTVRHRNFSRPGGQVWGAASADGRWAYRRLEETGTPWVVLVDGSEWGGQWFGTLASARRATAAHDAKETAA
jgi:hypothetical protein